MLLVGDLIVVLLAYAAAFWLRSLFSFYVFDDVMPPHRIYDVVHYIWLLVPAQIVIFYLFGLYEPSDAYQARPQVRPILGAITLVTVLLAAFYFFRGNVPFPRSILPVFWLLNCALVVGFRVIAFSFLIKGRPKRTAIVVGTSTVAKTLLRSIAERDELRLGVVGVVRAPGENAPEAEICGFRVLGDISDVPRIVEEQGVEEILLASPDSWQQQFLPSLLNGRYGAHVSVIPSDYEILIGRLQDFRISDVPLIEIEPRLRPVFQRAIKRTADELLSLSLFILLSPFFALIGALIRLTSKGPAFYRQRRIGKSERVFDIVKFRTMRMNAEEHTGPVLSTDSDPRVTPIGRFLRRTGLDELPQLINVIKGQMSFVGPRPERPVFVEEYKKRIPGYSQRFAVLPGMTGLAQINGSYASIPEVKIKYDLGYIQNFSIWLDLFIIVETMKIVITGKRPN